MQPKQLYSVFQVADCKGGELISNVNLSFDELLDKVSQLFIYKDEIRELLHSESIEQKIQEIINDENVAFFAEYAGDDDGGFHGVIYTHIAETSRLVEIPLEDLVKPLAEYIVKQRAKL